MKLSEIIDVFIAGDWGNECPCLEAPHAVSCVRGADIVPIRNNEFANIPLRYVSEHSFQQKLLQVGDIVIEKSGGSPTQSTGRVVYISQALLSASKDIVCSNFCVAFRVKEGWNSFFIYQYWQYLYNSGVFFNFEGKTSGIKNLQLDIALSTIEIESYPIENQTAVANCLEAFEKKIALNRSLNHNLEAIIADIMDYRFLSNINTLPKRLVGDIAFIRAGGDCPQVWSKHKTNDYQVPIYSNGTDNEGLYGYTKEATILKRGITVAARGTIGYCVMREAGYVPIIRLLAVTPNDTGGDVYLYQFFNRLKFRKDGSIQQQLTVPSLVSMEIPYPNASALKFFADKTYPIIEKINQNKTQIEQLTKQRDELLPLLMNGQVKVGVERSRLNYDLSHD